MILVPFPKTLDVFLRFFCRLHCSNSSINSAVALKMFIMMSSSVNKERSSTTSSNVSSTISNYFDVLLLLQLHFANSCVHVERHQIFSLVTIDVMRMPRSMPVISKLDNTRNNLCFDLFSFSSCLNRKSRNSMHAALFQ